MQKQGKKQGKGQKFVLVFSNVSKINLLISMSNMCIEYNIPRDTCRY